jgi:hypothetical protein
MKSNVYKSLFIYKVYVKYLRQKPTLHRLGLVLAKLIDKTSQRNNSESVYKHLPAQSLTLIRLNLIRLTFM